MPPERHQLLSSSCWECEQETDTPRTVALRVDDRDIGTVLLCLACYRTCYLPLARADSGVLSVSIRRSHTGADRHRP